MKQATADRMNALARMTPEDRDAELVAEIFGSAFDAMFPQMKQPMRPDDEPLPGRDDLEDSE